MKRLRVAMLLPVVIIVALALCAFQGGALPETPCEALTWIGTSAGIGMLLGVAVSAALEYWPAWEGFAPKIKRPIVLGFCLVVPVLSLVGQSLLCGAGIDQQALYRALLAGIAAFTASQFAHIPQLPSG